VESAENGGGSGCSGLGLDADSFQPPASVGFNGHDFAKELAHFGDTVLADEVAEKLWRMLIFELRRMGMRTSCRIPGVYGAPLSGVETKSFLFYNQTGEGEEEEEEEDSSADEKADAEED